MPSRFPRARHWETASSALRSILSALGRVIRKYGATDISESIVAPGAPSFRRKSGVSQLTRPIRELDFDVERRRWAPLSAAVVKEPVIVQMVVHICDQDREGDPSPQLVDVLLGVRTEAADGVDNFRVRVLLRVRRFRAQQRRRGEIASNAPRGRDRTVE